MFISFVLATCTKLWPRCPPVSEPLPHKIVLYSCPLPAKYIPDENELLETENLEIVGEDPGNASLETGTVPVRILTGFSLFDVETGHLVTLHSLLAPRDSPRLASYCAVGYVLPATENALDDAGEVFDPDYEDRQYLRLSMIRSMSLFDFDEDIKALDRYSLLKCEGWSWPKHLNF